MSDFNHHMKFFAWTFLMGLGISGFVYLKVVLPVETISIGIAYERERIEEKEKMTDERLTKVETKVEEARDELQEAKRHRLEMAATIERINNGK